ncbi:MAG: 30S ribosomal protein S16 [Phycisphaerae bacterium]|nr:30S ribosomal protein S16 [Phycisphaerae bacterium]
MAVCLRLVRLGRRHRAFFRLRAADSRAAATGRFLEELGIVDPLEKDAKKQAVLKKDRIEYWLSQGATVSPTVRSLLKRHDIGQPTESSSPVGEGALG